MPGVTESKRKRPMPSLVVLAGVPEEELKTTLALGITAPVGSMTCPDTEPLPWAEATDANPNIRMSAKRIVT